MSRANRALTIRLEDVQVSSPHSMWKKHLDSYHEYNMTYLLLCPSIEELGQAEQ